MGKKTALIYTVYLKTDGCKNADSNYFGKSMIFTSCRIKVRKLA